MQDLVRLLHAATLAQRLSLMSMQSEVESRDFAMRAQASDVSQMYWLALTRPPACLCDQRGRVARIRESPLQIQCPKNPLLPAPVSYTHLTLPTKA